MTCLLIAIERIKLLLRHNPEITDFCLKLDLPLSRKCYSYDSNRLQYAILRQDLLHNIQTGLSMKLQNQIGPAVVVLLGMGGAGKSLVALQCCRIWETEQRVNAIFWVDASSPKSVKQSFVDILEKLTGSGQDMNDDLFGERSRKPIHMKTLVSRMKMLLLERYDNKWLIVFDNFDEPHAFKNELLSDYWPTSDQGFILITSRNETSKLLGYTVEVPTLSPIQATDLLLQRSGNEDTEENRKFADTIGELLGHLALAVDQAAAYILTNHWSLKQYPDLFRRSRKAVLARIPEASVWQYRRKLTDSELETTLSVFTTWNMSFVSIQGSSEERIAKQRLMTLSAFFDHSQLSSQIFDPYFELNHSFAETTGETIFFTDRNEVDLDDTLIELKKLSLLQSFQRHDDGKISYSLHPLVKDWAKLRLTPESRREHAIEAVNLLARFLPAPRFGKSEQFSMTWTRQFLSHINACMENCQEYLKVEELPGVGPLYQSGMKIAGFYVRQKQQQLAIPICARALAGRERTHSDTDEETLDIIIRLSAFYGQIHQYDLELRLANRAMIASKLIPSDSYSRGFALVRMGELRKREGFFEEAIDYLKEGILVMRNYYGTNRQPVLNAMSQLSSVFYDREQYDIAKLHALSVVDGNLHLNGPSHPNTIQTQQFLIEIYLGMKAFAEAELDLSKMKVLVDRIYGANHSLAVETDRLRARLLGLQNKYTEGEMLLSQTADRYARLYGPSDTRTLDCQTDLAFLQYCAKKYDKALTTLIKGLERCDSSIPYTVSKHRMQMLLGSIYNQQRRYEDAGRITEQMLLAKDHWPPPYREKTMWSIYFQYIKEKKFDKEPGKIKESLDQAIQTTEKYLGFNYPRGRVKLDYALTGYLHLKDSEMLDLYTGKLLDLTHSTTKKVYAVDEKKIAEEAAFPLPPDLHSSVPYSEQLKEAERIIRQELASHGETKGRIDLQNIHLNLHLARVVGKQGRSDEAKNLFTNVLNALQNSRSEEHHPNILHAETEFAKFLLERKQFNDAAQSFAKLMRQRRKWRSESMLVIYNSYLPEIMSSCKQDNGFKGLETFLIALLTEFDKCSPADQAWTALVLNDLGDTYRVLEDYGSAETSYRRALALFDEHSVSTHEIRLCASHGLATAVQKQSKFRESESIYRTALENRTLLLGPEHNDTIHTKYGLALLYEDQARYTEAEKYCQEALDDRIGESYFSKDAMTMNYMHTLANIFKCQSRSDEAETLIREVITWRKEELGFQNLDTLLSQLLLGQILLQRNNYEEAEKLFRHVYEGRKKVLGAESPFTLSVSRDFGLAIEALNRFSEAEAIFRDAFAICQKMSDPSQIDLIWATHYLARTLFRQGKFAEAEEMFRACLEIQETMRGKDHDDTMISIVAVGQCLQEQGKNAEAEPFYQRAHTHKSKILGPKHPETLDFLFMLASLNMQPPEKLPIAAERLTECARLREEALGPLHSFTLVTKYRLAQLYQKQDRLQEARQILDTILDNLLTASPAQDVSFLEHTLRTHGEIRWLLGSREAAKIPYRRVLALYLTFSNTPIESEILIRAGAKKPHIAAWLEHYGRTQTAADLSVESDDAARRPRAGKFRLTSSATSTDQLTCPRYCDACLWTTQEGSDILGPIYHCLECSDADLCEPCFKRLRGLLSADALAALPYVPAGNQICVREHEFLSTGDYAVTMGSGKGEGRLWEVEFMREVFEELRCEDETGAKWIEGLNGK